MHRKQLQEVQAEWEESAIAERVLHRLAERIGARRRPCRNGSGEGAGCGCAVLLIPHRSDSLDETA
ncbi:hypothetical protein [Streptomyces sp. NPDC002851]